MNETSINLADTLTPEDLLSIGSRQSGVFVDDETMAAVERSRETLTTRLDSGEAIYGVTTGFGPFVDKPVDHDAQIELQMNLMQQLGCNVGPHLPSDVVRAIMAVRARALARGASGVRSRVLNSLVDMINSGATPVIRRFGSVGASGDLVPLAMLARCMAGWDTIRLPDGQVIDNSPGTLADLGIDAFSPQPKEALAVVNGTSFSSAIASVCTARTLRSVNETVLPLVATALTLLDESHQHLSSTIYRFKAHDSAKQVAESLRRLMDLDDPSATPGLPQPPYSSRSAVLWYGAAVEKLDSAHKTLLSELNSVDDNPLSVPDEDLLLHGANFQGTYTALAADDLSEAIGRIAVGIERLINRILHENYNGDLPAFLADEPIGLHSGLQGCQLLATSLTADIRTRQTGHGLSSIPTNGDNQDIVSMSANAALNAMELSDRFAQLLAVAECVFARAVSLARDDLPSPLEAHWERRSDLVGADFTHGDLSALIDERHMEIWNGQPV